MYCKRNALCQPPATSASVSNVPLLTFASLRKTVDTMRASQPKAPYLISEGMYARLSELYDGGADKFADDLHHIVCSWGFDSFLVVPKQVAVTKLQAAIGDFAAAILDEENKQFKYGDGRST